MCLEALKLNSPPFIPRRAKLTQTDKLGSPGVVHLKLTLLVKEQVFLHNEPEIKLYYSKITFKRKLFFIFSFWACKHWAGFLGDHDNSSDLVSEWAIVTANAIVWLLLLDDSVKCAC